MDPLAKLHPDIMLNILSRLPTDVYRCKLVCKPWRDLLRDTKVGLLFCLGLDNDKYGTVQLYYGGHQYDEINIDKHVYSYKTLTKLDHPPITVGPQHFYVMLGSCNGLVCFCITHHEINDPVYICNPITSEFVHLPRLKTSERNPWRSHRLASGFGYHHSTNEYKVVRIYYDGTQPTRVGQVQVYTLGDRSGWRNKRSITHFCVGPGVFANGSIYWMNCKANKIVAFDLADEEFRLLPSPCLLLTASLQSLRGHLCVICRYAGGSTVIWTLRNNEKSSSSEEVAKEQDYHSRSWRREYSTAWEGLFNSYRKLLAVTNRNEILLWYKGNLSCYDPKTASVKKLWDDYDSESRYTQVIPHINSIVSLKALGEKSEKRR